MYNSKGPTGAKAFKDKGKSKGLKKESDFPTGNSQSKLSKGKLQTAPFTKNDAMDKLKKKPKKAK